MAVQIIEAGEDLKQVVLNLGLYYIHDFTEFIGFRCPDSGLYRTSHWEKFWTEPGRWAFLVKVDGELAGFALVGAEGVLRDSEYSMEEFFILRKFRGQGVGSEAALDIFNRLRGRWEVRQVVQNGPAMVFWLKVIDRYTDGKYTELPEPVEHGQWVSMIQTFDNSVQRK